MIELDDLLQHVRNEFEVKLGNKIVEISLVPEKHADGRRHVHYLVELEKGQDLSFRIGDEKVAVLNIVDIWPGKYDPAEYTNKDKDGWFCQCSVVREEPDKLPPGSTREPVDNWMHLVGYVGKLLVDKETRLLRQDLEEGVDYISTLDLTYMAQCAQYREEVIRLQLEEEAMGIGFPKKRKPSAWNVACNEARKIALETGDFKAALEHIYEHGDAGGAALVTMMDKIEANLSEYARRGRHARRHLATDRQGAANGDGLRRTRSRFRRRDFRGLEALPLDKILETHTLLITGASGIGKSYFADTLLPKSLVVDSYESAKYYVPHLHRGLIFDDPTGFDRYGKNSAVSLVDVNRDVTLPARYAAIPLEMGTPRIILMNDLPNTYFKIVDPNTKKECDLWDTREFRRRIWHIHLIRKPGKTIDGCYQYIALNYGAPLDGDDYLANGTKYNPWVYRSTYGGPAPPHPADTAEPERRPPYVKDLHKQKTIATDVDAYHTFLGQEERQAKERHERYDTEAEAAAAAAAAALEATATGSTDTPPTSTPSGHSSIGLGGPSIGCSAGADDDVSGSGSAVPTTTCPHRGAAPPPPPRATEQTRSLPLPGIEPYPLRSPGASTASSVLISSAPGVFEVEVIELSDDDEDQARSDPRRKGKQPVGRLSTLQGSVQLGAPKSEPREEEEEEASRSSYDGDTSDDAYDAAEADSDSATASIATGGVPLAQLPPQRINRETNQEAGVRLRPDSPETPSDAPSCSDDTSDSESDRDSQTTKQLRAKFAEACAEEDVAERGARNVNCESDVSEDEEADSSDREFIDDSGTADAGGQGGQEYVPDLSAHRRHRLSALQRTTRPGNASQCRLADVAKRLERQEAARSGGKKRVTTRRMDASPPLSPPASEDYESQHESHLKAVDKQITRGTRLDIGQAAAQWTVRSGTAHKRAAEKSPHSDTSPPPQLISSSSPSSPSAPSSCGPRLRLRGLRRSQQQQQQPVLLLEDEDEEEEERENQHQAAVEPEARYTGRSVNTVLAPVSEYPNRSRPIRHKPVDASKSRQMQLAGSVHLVVPDSNAPPTPNGPVTPAPLRGTSRGYAREDMYRDFDEDLDRLLPRTPPQPAAATDGALQQRPPGEGQRDEQDFFDMTRTGS